jgi:hypothetical protein
MLFGAIKSSFITHSDDVRMLMYDYGPPMKASK